MVIRHNQRLQFGQPVKRLQPSLGYLLAVGDVEVLEFREFRRDLVQAPVVDVPAALEVKPLELAEPAKVAQTLVVQVEPVHVDRFEEVARIVSGRYVERAVRLPLDPVIVSLEPDLTAAMNDELRGGDIRAQYLMPLRYEGLPLPGALDLGVPVPVLQIGEGKVALGRRVGREPQELLGLLRVVGELGLLQIILLLSPLILPDLVLDAVRADVLLYDARVLAQLLSQNASQAFAEHLAPRTEVDST